MIKYDLSNYYPKSNVLRQLIVGHVYADAKGVHYVFLGKTQYNELKKTLDTTMPSEFLYMRIALIQKYLKTSSSLQELVSTLIQEKQNLIGAYLNLCQQPKKLVRDIGTLFSDQAELTSILTEKYENPYVPGYFYKSGLNLTLNKLHISSDVDTAPIYSDYQTLNSRKKPDFVFDLQYTVTKSISIKADSEEEARKQLKHICAKYDNCKVLKLTRIDNA